MKYNKLIAEFMGLKYYEPFFEVTDESQMEKIEVRKGKVISFGYMFEPHELRYHESWAWLMPVVEKIKNIAVKDENIEVFYEVANHIPDRHETYKAVVEFIKWYNNKKT